MKHLHILKLFILLVLRGAIGGQFLFEQYVQMCVHVIVYFFGRGGGVMIKVDLLEHAYKCTTEDIYSNVHDVLLWYSRRLSLHKTKVYTGRFPQQFLWLYYSLNIFALPQMLFVVQNIKLIFKKSNLIFWFRSIYIIFIYLPMPANIFVVFLSLYSDKVSKLKDKIKYYI